MFDMELMCTQAEFAALVGLSEPAVSQLKAAGVLADGAPAGVWLRAYVHRLREQAAGRLGVEGGPDLVHERAGLARVQRLAAELRLDEQRGELVKAGDVKRLLSARLVHARETLLSVPARLAAVLSAETDPARVHVLIEAEMHHTLGVLSGVADAQPAQPQGADL